MASAGQTESGQTPEEIAAAFRNSAEEHFKKRLVPIGVLVLFGVADHLIPKGLPTTLEEVAISGYMLEFARQSYLVVRDRGNAGEVEKLGTSADNAPPTQSP